MSEAAGNDRRLRILMVDIATNCAKRLKNMKDVALVGATATITLKSNVSIYCTLM